MPTRRLPLTSARIISLPPTAEEKIEVPAGETIYHLPPYDPHLPDQKFIFTLIHPHSSLRVTGLVEAFDESSPVLRTEVIHQASYTKAETEIRTLVYDSARPTYEGLIHIDPDTVGCESYLNHHSLLVGSEAKSYSWPALEILANEVKCSHAATISTITEDDLFYLRTRGIPAIEAKQALIKAFKESF